MQIDKMPWLCYVGRKADLKLHSQRITGIMEIIWFCSARLQTLKIISGGNLSSFSVCTTECDLLGCGSSSEKIPEGVNVAPSI